MLKVVGYRFHPDDTEYEPAERRELCLNCGMRWGVHEGWACPGLSCARAKFDKIDPINRYTTKDMLDTVPAAMPTQCSQVASLKTQDLSDWRAWANVLRTPHECPCGIDLRRGRCDYHPSPRTSR